jgi:hypothetical protein
MDALTLKYAKQGHPSLDELAAAQGSKVIENPEMLYGDFWPEDDLDEFLAQWREWRGHARSDRAA